MTLKVFTSTIGYAGDDALDVTRGRGTGDALVFAPSWEILRPVVDSRSAVPQLMSVHGLSLEEAKALVDEQWKIHEVAYLREMKASYRQNTAVWKALLARDRVTAKCFCDLAKWPGRCHRLLLAGMLAKCGAEYLGEVSATGSR